MSDISNQLIKDSYNYVLQSDVSTGNIYRIGGGIPVNPIFLSGLTINGELIASSISATTITTPFSGGSVLFAGTSGQISQDNSQLFWDNTNNRLGIGTPTPGSKLTIIGNNNIQFAGVSPQNMPAYVGTNSDDNFYAYSSGQGSGKFSTLGPPNGTSISTNSGQIAFNTGNGSITERMRINSSTGNILIGTTTDSGHRLDVNGGTARFSGNVTLSSQLNLPGNNFSGTYKILVNSQPSSGDLVSGTRNCIQDQVNFFNPNSGSSTVYNSFVSSPTINQTNGSSGTTRGLYINPTLTSAYDFRAIETTNGKVIFGGTGNVLIGTTVDSGYKLDVSGTVRVTGDTTSLTFNASNNGGSYKVQGTNVLDYGNGIRIGYFNGVQKITLYTNAGTPQLTVLNTGNVLIGTTTDAGYKLDVNGNTRITGNLTVSGNTNITGGLTATTISATTYQNLPVQTNNNIFYYYNNF